MGTYENFNKLKKSPKFRLRLSKTKLIKLLAIPLVGMLTLGNITVATVSASQLTDSKVIKIDYGKLPADRSPSPLTATKLVDSGCAPPGILTNKNITHYPPYIADIFNYHKLWKFSKGKGQTVAVIDSGVAKHPRIKYLLPGGDYVSSQGNGLQDCDLHGTAVAGLIAASPSPHDSFAGIAPEAKILAIRNFSEYYQEKDYTAKENDNQLSNGYGNLETLALAIVHAVNLKATVINISQIACATPSQIFDANVGAAIKYAYDHNVVVVMAAGNVGDHNCKANSLEIPANKDRLSVWNEQNTIATPARYSEYAITVGAVDRDGNPWKNSLAGPWVTVAAPGTNIVSLHARYASTPNSSELIDRFQGSEGLTELNGTSFAAPLVAGEVALVRAKFPNYSARQIINLITSTATGSSFDSRVGYGMVDPLAALTFKKVSAPTTSKSISQAVNYVIPPTHSAQAHHRYKLLGLLGLILIFGGAAWVILNAFLPKRKTYQDEF